jgi:hypothetical protein
VLLLPSTESRASRRSQVSAFPIVAACTTETTVASRPRVSWYLDQAASSMSEGRVEFPHGCVLGCSSLDRYTAFVVYNVHSFHHSWAAAPVVCPALRKRSRFQKSSPKSRLVGRRHDRTQPRQKAVLGHRVACARHCTCLSFNDLLRAFCAVYAAHTRSHTHWCCARVRV